MASASVDGLHGLVAICDAFIRMLEVHHVRVAPALRNAVQLHCRAVVEAMHDSLLKQLVIEMEQVGRGVLWSWCDHHLHAFSGCSFSLMITFCVFLARAAVCMYMCISRQLICFLTLRSSLLANIHHLPRSAGRP